MLSAMKLICIKTAKIRANKIIIKNVTIDVLLCLKNIISLIVDSFVNTVNIIILLFLTKKKTNNIVGKYCYLYLTLDWCTLN